MNENLNRQREQRSAGILAGVFENSRLEAGATFRSPLPGGES